MCETSAALLLIYVFDTVTILGNNLNLTLSSQQTAAKQTGMHGFKIDPGLSSLLRQQNHTRARARKLQ